MPLAHRADPATAQPSPISLTASETWGGSDGNWSAFTISVGTPPQSLVVVPATSETGFRVPLSTTCSANSSQCSSFQPDLSATWVASNATAGFDVLFDGSRSLGNQSIGNVSESTTDNAADRVGYIGLGAVPSILLGTGLWSYVNVAGAKANVQDASFIQSLYTQKSIPSLSYGYTAGAWYRACSPEKHSPPTSLPLWKTQL
jgi:hypothetical protein